jgi:hypothetical protein
MSTHRNVQSFIVWMMAGIAERETARKVMRRWREPREMVMTFAFFVAQPMETGRRGSSICQPSVVKAPGTRKVNRVDAPSQSFSASFYFLLEPLGLSHEHRLVFSVDQ